MRTLLWPRGSLISRYISQIFRIVASIHGQSNAAIGITAANRWEALSTSCFSNSTSASPNGSRVTYASFGYIRLTGLKRSRMPLSPSPSRLKDRRSKLAYGATMRHYTQSSTFHIKSQRNQQEWKLNALRESGSIQACPGWLMYQIVGDHRWLAAACRKLNILRVVRRPRYFRNYRVELVLRNE